MRKRALEDIEQIQLEDRVLALEEKRAKLLYARSRRRSRETEGAMGPADTSAEEDVMRRKMDGSAATQHMAISGRDDGREADQGAVGTVRRQPLTAGVQVDEEDVSGRCKNTL